MKEQRLNIDHNGKAFCLRCGQEAKHNEHYDSYYCVNCNIWLEERCVDPLCSLCKRRPIRPIKKKKEIKKKNNDGPKQRRKIEW